ncbi:MAG: phosphate signaling complex protein PhoU [Clostridiales bacterium]|nr:phosphate signaling complex protein PhoU [Clostridiales bacterium]
MSNRAAYDWELKNLDRTLEDMGVMAQQALNLALETFTNGTPQLLEEIPHLQEQLNQLERDVEHQCMTLLLRQQPVASDLRKVSTSLEIVEDIRRIGDFAADMADILQHMESSRFTQDSLHADIVEMAANAKRMVSRAILAFRTLDSQLAQEVIDYDDVVDQAFLSIRNSLAQRIAAQTESVDYALDYLMMIKYLERLGDHAVSIAQWVGFCITGVHKAQRIV